MKNPEDKRHLFTLIKGLDGKEEEMESDEVRLDLDGQIFDLEEEESDGFLLDGDVMDRDEEAISTQLMEGGGVSGRGGGVEAEVGGLVLLHQPSWRW